MLLGGAALTRTYVERDLREVYEGRLFYGKDAFEGLHVMDRLGEIKRGAGDRRPRLRPRAHRVAACRPRSARRARRRSTGRRCPPARPRSRPTTRSSCRRSSASQVVKGIAARRHRRLPQRDGAVPQPVAVPARERGENDDEFKDRHPPDAARAAGRGQGRRRARARRSSTATSPANGDGNDLVIWKDETPHRRVDCASASPARASEPCLCIADFFRPIESGEADYAAFHIVTMGAAVSRGDRRAVRRRTSYQDYLLLHGLGVEMAEALAEYWHRRIREEWGFADEDGPTLAGLFRQQYRGGRYSWGYPACPDLEDNAQGGRAARRRPHRHRGQRGDRLPVPARADDLGASSATTRKAKYFVAR